MRQPKHLDVCAALIIPGGESTTISKLAVSTGLFDPIHDRLVGGMAALGTCAGAIMLGNAVIDGRSDQRSFARIDMSVRRNGYGRQIDSFETEISVEAFDGAFHGVFIRAPILEHVGPDVEILAVVDDHPVLVRQGRVLAATFHPELSGDDRIHEVFVSSIED